VKRKLLTTAHERRSSVPRAPSILVAIAVFVSGVTLAGCGDGGEKTYQPQVATFPPLTPKELKERKRLNSMSDKEVERATVKQLIREGNGLLDEIWPIVKVKHDDPATVCPALRKLDGKIDDLGDVVGNLEGIDISARTRGVAILRRAADGLRARYNVAAQACTELGFYVRH
jgi:hypothetical protein